MNHADHLN